MEHASLSETSLTLADLCAALERGDLPYTIHDGAVVVRRDDVRTLERNQTVRRHLRLADETLHSQDETFRPSRSA